MKHLSSVKLNVRSPKTLADFYCTHMGMTARQQGDMLVVGYEGIDADIELHQGSSGSYVHGKADRYWKIGITLPNVDMAYAQLIRAGVSVSAPRQFIDIGYMCHLTDPEGFVIELLQHDFEDNRPVDAGNSGQPLGGGGCVGQITLRTNDIEAELKKYRDDKGMKLLSIQSVGDFGFTLYFLACTNETPPNPDVEAVENREWLWRRPYTTLEFQYFNEDQTVVHSHERALGFKGISFT